MFVSRKEFHESNNQSLIMMIASNLVALQSGVGTRKGRGLGFCDLRTKKIRE